LYEKSQQVSTIEQRQNDLISHTEMLHLHVNIPTNLANPPLHMQLYFISKNAASTINYFIPNFSSFHPLIGYIIYNLLRLCSQLPTKMLKCVVKIPEKRGYHSFV